VINGELLKPLARHLMSRAGDPRYWRERAEKALRLARSIPNEDVAQRLKALAADYLERADSLQADCPPAELTARPEAAPQQMQQQQQQQQQQPQPDPKPEPDE
jgi:hypothetical protein